MNAKINPDIDIVAFVLKAVLAERPYDAFTKSLQDQYIERGGLSKKQLEGLMGKASRISGIQPGKLATLEAIIKKKHVTHRSEVTIKNITEEKDYAAGQMIDKILAKYPQHKRVILFKSKFEKEGKLVPAEKQELEKFSKLLLDAK